MYMIKITCNDMNNYYEDKIDIIFTTFDKAKEELDKSIMKEYEELVGSNDDREYYIIDYNESKIQNYEREIWCRTDEYEDMLTRYTIVKVEVR